MADFNSVISLTADASGLKPAITTMRDVEQAGAKMEDRLTSALDAATKAMTATAGAMQAAIGTASKSMDGASAAMKRATDGIKRSNDDTQRSNQKTEQTFHDLRMAIDPLYASSNRYAQVADQIKAAADRENKSLAETNRLLDQASQRYLAPIQGVNRLAQAQDAAVGSSNRASSAFVNAGFQVQDFAVQVASGQSAMTAFAQQAPQLLGAFGFVGKIAIAASVIATLGSIAFAVLPKIEGVGAAFKSMSDVIDGSTGLITTVTNGLVFLGDNIDRLAVYAGTAVGAWVAYTAAMGAMSAATAIASATTAQLAVAMGVLRGALIRTGFLAVAVAAGELVYQFLRVVKGAGGVGNALVLVGDVARDVWAGIVNTAANIPAGLAATWELVKADFSKLVASLARVWSGFLQQINEEFGTINLLSWGDTDILSVTTPIGNALDGARARADEFAASMDAAAAASTAAAGVAGAGIVDGFKPAGESLQKLRDVASEAGDLFGLPTWGNGPKDIEKGAKGAKSAMDEAAKAAKKWQDRIQDAQDPTDKYNRELAELDGLLKSGALNADEYAKAVGMIRGELGDAIPWVSKLSDAFGDFVSSGFKIKDMLSNVGDWFKDTIANMVSTAAKNRIVIGITGGSAVAGAASAGEGGGLGGMMQGAGLLGKIGGFGSSIISGITAPLQAALSSATNGGLAQGFQTYASSLKGMASGANGLGAQIGAYLGPAIAGTAIGGMLAGDYKIAGLGGTVTSGLGAAIGAAILGPLGGFLGGALGGLTNRLFGKKLTGQGVGARFNGASSDGYSYQTYKGGLFGGGGTKERGIGAEMEGIIADTYGQLRKSVTGMADTLGIAASAFDNFSYSFQFSTKGLSEEEVTARFQEEMQKAGSAMADMVAGLDKYTLKGEDSITAMTRLSTSLTAVQSVADTLGHKFTETGLAGASLASDLAALFGGIEGMASATQTYYNAFYSEEERRATLLRQMTAQLGKINVVIPKTRDEYRKMIEAQDLSTKRGQEVYAALIQMAAGMDSVLPTIGNLTDAMQVLAVNVSTGLDASIAAAGEAAKASEASAKLWYDAAGNLRQFLRDLNTSSASRLNPQQQLLTMQREYDRLLKGVMAGDVKSAQQLTQASGQLLDMVRASSGSQVDYNRQVAKIQRDLQLAAGIADAEGGNDDVLKTLYEAQIAMLKQVAAQLAAGELTADAIKKFEGSMGSLEDAIKAAEMFSYDYLKERLQVTVDLIGTANIPKEMKDLLANATHGVTANIDFILRKDLPPDAKWLALNAASEHITTLNFLVKNKPPADIITLATKNVIDLTRTINLLAGAKLDDDTRRIALAGSSELSRVVNVALSSKASKEAIKLALANTGAYAVTVSAALSGKLPDAVDRLVMKQSGTYAAMIEAAISGKMTDDQRRILLIRQGEYIATVGATLKLSAEARQVMLARQGLYFATIGAGWSNLSGAQKNVIFNQGGGYLAEIFADWNLSDLQKQVIWNKGSNYLTTINGDWNLSEMQKQVLWKQGGGYLATISAGLSSSVTDAQRVLLLNANTSAARAVTILATMGNSLTPEQRAALLQQTATVTKTISGVMDAGRIRGNDLAVLQQGNQTVQKVINAVIETGNLTDQQKTLLGAISGTSNGKVTLGGSFSFDPSKSFTVWYESATTSGIKTPMDNLRSSLDALRRQMEVVPKLNASAANLTRNSDGTVFATTKQINSLAAQAGLSTKGKSVSQIGAELANLSGTDSIQNIQAIASLEDLLWREFTRASDKIKVKPDDYLRAFPQYKKSGLTAQEHYNAYGRDAFLSKQRGFRPSIFDWTSIGLTVPAFARGGLHMGGLRLVGENGPELEATGPSRIYNASQTRDMLQGDDGGKDAALLAEVKAMREENRQLIMQVAMYARRTFELQQKWDSIGLPPEQTAMDEAS